MKLKYYELMIQHALKHKDFLDVTKYYYKVWETTSIKEDENGKGKEVSWIVLPFRCFLTNLDYRHWNTSSTTLSWLLTQTSNPT